MTVATSALIPQTPAGAVRFGDSQFKELEQRLIEAQRLGEDTSELERQLKKLTDDMGAVSRRAPGVLAQTSALVGSSSALV